MNQSNGQSGMTFCWYHPAQAGTAVCAACGKPLCTACAQLGADTGAGRRGGRILCYDCKEKDMMAQVKALKDEQSRYIGLLVRCVIGALAGLIVGLILGSIFDWAAPAKVIVCLLLILVGAAIASVPKQMGAAMRDGLGIRGGAVWKSILLKIAGCLLGIVKGIVMMAGAAAGSISSLIGIPGRIQGVLNQQTAFRKQFHSLAQGLPQDPGSGLPVQ